MSKFLKVYDVKINGSCYEGLIDPEQLSPSQLTRLGVKDLDVPLTCGGEFTVRSTLEAGDVVTIDHMIIDGCNGFGKFPTIDVFDNYLTFEHIAGQIERRLLEIGEVKESE